MANKIEINQVCESSAYQTAFNNYLVKNAPFSDNHLKAYVEGGHLVPTSMQHKIEKVMDEKCAFRNIATVHKCTYLDTEIVTGYADDIATFIPEATQIPATDVSRDFKRVRVSRNKIAMIFKEPSDFIEDSGFDVESYLASRIGKCFAKTEDKAFVDGTGVNEPTGILHPAFGAATALTTESLTYDNLIELYFSIDKELRANGVWLMNDKTAEIVKKLKDEAGNYLWKDNDTILGKKVVINNYMPDIAPGSKPIAFGDFSFYWIIDRSSVSINVLSELFIVNQMIGYIAYTHVDGKLIKRDAIQVIKIAE